MRLMIMPADSLFILKTAQAYAEAVILFKVFRIKQFRDLFYIYMQIGSTQFVLCEPADGDGFCCYFEFFILQFNWIAEKKSFNDFAFLFCFLLPNI